MIYLLIVLFILTLIVAYGMGEGYVRDLLAAFILLIVFTVIVAYLTLGEYHTNGYNEGYKDGQIQAIIGNHHFHREVQPDSTVIWIKTH